MLLLVHSSLVIFVSCMSNYCVVKRFMKDFGLNCIQCIVDTMFKSQQQEMVDYASEIEVDSGPSGMFYLL